jgi:hypothetical protein
MGIPVTESYSVRAREYDHAAKHVPLKRWRSR